jgi:signal transduction histidine kinase
MAPIFTRALQRLRRSAFAFPLAVLVAGLMVLISELGYHQSANQLGSLVERGQARLQLMRLVRRMADAESGQRGYLLTGRADYLTPYRFASADVQDSLQQLRRLYGSGGDSDGLATITQLDTHARSKLSEMDEVLSLYNAGRQQSARELTASGIGRDEMVSIRAAVDALMARQNADVARGLAYIFDTLQLNRVGVAALTAISLLVLGMYLRQRHQGDEERVAQQRQLRAERDRLEVEVASRTAELTDLARHLETAREDERARLARDLHDELGALLTAAKLDVARMRPKLAQEAPDLVPRLTHLVETLNSGIALKRRIIEDLRPSTLSNLGLLPALEILCAEAAERLGLPVRTTLAAVPLTASGDLTAFRLVQEALNNIAKHAQARLVTVQVAAAGSEARIVVTDDGLGFDAGQVGLARHGLVGMRYRVQAEGGRLQVQSAPGQGTRIEAWLPLAATAPADGPV